MTEGNNPVSVPMTSHKNCSHPKTAAARYRCRRESEGRPEMTPEDRRERASRAGKARWEGKGEDAMLEHRIKSLHSEAQKLGFRLVPIPSFAAGASDSPDANADSTKS